MKKTDTAVQLFISEIANKKILEVACGTAEFSDSASGYAKSVSCIDLTDSRFVSMGRNNVHFEIMDASKMLYPDETFDTVFLYNALFHVRFQWEAIKEECLRVLKPEGSICIVGSWKLDIALIHDIFGDKARSENGLSIVKMQKTMSTS